MTGKKPVSEIAKLYVPQAFGLILPWLTVPFLLRILGAEEYGWIVLATTSAQYLSLVTDYAYGITAPRDVVRATAEKGGLEAYLSAFYSTRIVILTVCAAVLAICLSTFPVLTNRWPLFALASVSVVGTALMPISVLFGLEEFGFAMKLSLAARILPAVFILLLVRDADGALLAVGIQSVAYLLVSLLGFLILRGKYHVRVKMAPLRIVQRELSRGLSSFVSVAAVSIYTSGPAILLGMFSSPASVGYYAAADKTLGAVRGGLMPVFQVFYPRIARLAPADIRLTSSSVRSALFGGGGIALVASLALLAFPGKLSLLLIGHRAAETEFALQWFGVLPVVLVLTFLFNDTIRLCLNMERERMITLVSAAALFVGIAVVMEGVLHAGVRGMVLSVVAVETVIALSAVEGYLRWRRKFREGGADAR